MRPIVSFLLITHRDQEQTLHLCSRLTAMFGDPPIAVHHDFSQQALDKSRFGRNVRFVDAHVHTDWGGFSVVRAQLAALQLLYSFADPDWVTLLSSADYPIQPADRILHELESTDFDAFLDSRPVRDLHEPLHRGSLGAFPFQQRPYLQTAYNRYVAHPLISRSTAKRLRTPVEAWVLKWRWLSERKTPFHSEYHCFAGDAWFTINRRTAEFFLAETPLRTRLLRHYESRLSPEESFYHTLLGNSPKFRVAPTNLRYTDWAGQWAHPRTLGREDFPRLLSSSDHFARKFPFDLALLGDWDRLLERKNAHIAH